MELSVLILLANLELVSAFMVEPSASKVSSKVEPEVGTAARMEACVLGSFCHCPENLYDRYCDYEMKERSCGPLQHLEFFRDD